ncbi:MAG: hypothetical protein MJZ26_05535 [Fibrobacter sp.]|nr:hypothetical protein [Fibrobacter sp.]
MSFSSSEKASCLNFQSVIMKVYASGTGMLSFHPELIPKTENFDTDGATLLGPEQAQKMSPRKSVKNFFIDNLLVLNPELNIKKTIHL